MEDGRAQKLQAGESGDRRSQKNWKRLRTTERAPSPKTENGWGRRNVRRTDVPKTLKNGKNDGPTPAKNWKRVVMKDEVHKKQKMGGGVEPTTPKSSKREGLKGCTSQKTEKSRTAWWIKYGRPQKIENGWGWRTRRWIDAPKHWKLLEMTDGRP